ncbi:hypothetical protein [Kitasatospora cinereorecta]|uniref:Peptide zinc metalloprotease protein n=1 Tax=Kitasatospora cinereorecta TaxID=285560 RepID=A0ABW0V6F8_9ACTN
MRWTAQRRPARRGPPPIEKGEDHVDTDPQAPAAGRPLPVPRLDAGLRLYGEYQGGGFTEPRYLARRGDGQVVQLSRLLHLVASSMDGVRDTAAIARRVSARFGREVSADNIRHLVEHKLRPMGLTAAEDGDDRIREAPRLDPLLALAARRTLLTEPRVARIARALAWLHRPPVVAAVLLAALALDVWLFGSYGAMGPVLRVLDRPLLLLAVLGLTLGSLLFHEFGHASACVYGGAEPGRIGFGLYLLWPSLYTDVTDVYRIGRVGRLRTDLGGVYFNVVFMLGLGGAYALTGRQVFLAAILVAHLEILEQLMPAVRLDGYYILGDLAGVPDLFGKIKPILLGMLPGRPVGPEVADLKRSARIVVTGWVLTMVPLLLGELGYVLWNLPRILHTALRSLAEQVAGTGAAFAAARIPDGVVGVVGILMLLCPLAGGAYLAARIGRLLIASAVRAMRGTGRRRAPRAAVRPKTASAAPPVPSIPSDLADPSGAGGTAHPWRPL